MTSTLTRGPHTTTTRQRWHGSSTSVQIMLLTSRSLRALVTDPGLVLFGLIQPVLTLFVFTQVFGNVVVSAHLPPGTTYLDFLMPAVLVNNAVQSSMQTGVGLVEDLKNGIVARLRSLPNRPSSLLFARSLSDLARSAVQVVILIILAITVFGYSPKGGAWGMLVTALLTLVAGWSLGWVFLAIGAWLRRTEPMQNISVLAFIPLMFASSAYVPIAELPPWLEAVARVNPLTYAVDATRAVALDTNGTDLVIPSLLISLLIATAGVITAVRGFRRPL